jgi:hypothetical protein
VVGGRPMPDPFISTQHRRSHPESSGIISSLGPEQRLDEFRLVSQGSTSCAYEASLLIIVKVPKPGEEERGRLHREVEIYNIFSRHPPCPYLIPGFFRSDNGTFLEYVRDICLSYGIQQHVVRNHGSRKVIWIQKLEPLSLRKRWMHDLTHPVAFLE